MSSGATKPSASEMSPASRCLARVSRADSGPPLCELSSAALAAGSARSLPELPLSCVGATEPMSFSSSARCHCSTRLPRACSSRGLVSSTQAGGGSRNAGLKRGPNDNRCAAVAMQRTRSCVVVLMEKQEVGMFTFAGARGEGRQSITAILRRVVYINSN